MDHPQIFTDFHHSSLLKSLILLFENRFGGKVFRPIGMTWFDRGYWHIFDAEATRLQYLGMDQASIPPDGTPPLNRIDQEMNDFYLCRDPEGGPYAFNRAITFEQFLNKPIDYIIASIPEHIVPFQRLIQEHKPNAKLIVQIGNKWSFENVSNARNILDSTKMQEIPTGANYQFYHQEFDINIFRPENWIYLDMDPRHPGIQTPGKKIYSFLNVLQETTEYNTFRSLEDQMIGWEFKSFGGQCRDGCITGNKQLADKMKEARFIIHLKTGDGYGHVLHNAAAVGRPLIIKKGFYRRSTAEDLLVDGVTCIDIDNLTLSDAMQKIEYYNDEERYRNLCQNMYRAFRGVVDFDKEAEEIRGFLDKCL